MAQPLTPKQERFVAEYLIDLNATQAAVRAGYSTRTARQAGAENLSKPVISARIAEAQSQRSKRTGIDQDWVLERLKAEAELSGEGSSHSARVTAIKAIGQHLGMFVERVELKREDTLRIVEVVIDASGSRPA